MHSSNPLQELAYWREQRAAIMQYIDAAPDSELREERLHSFTSSMRKIDARILRLENEMRSPDVASQPV